MASNTTTLPSWASSVVFTDEKLTKTKEVLQLALKEVVHLWWQLGLELGQNPSSLDKIKTRPQKESVQTKFRNMLDHWINQGEQEYRTWGALASAVESAGNRALARKLRKSKDYQESSRVEMGLQELVTLLRALTADWKTLSSYLGIDQAEIEQIEERLKVEECFREVLSKWITNSDSDKEPTLEVLYKALESYSVANRALAMKILTNVKVLELLTESDDSVGDQLKHCIAGLKTETDGLAAAVDALPAPPTTKPGTVSSTCEKETVLVETK